MADQDQLFELAVMPMPYKDLKTSLRALIDADMFAQFPGFLYSKAIQKWEGSGARNSDQPAAPDPVQVVAKAAKLAQAERNGVCLRAATNALLAQRRPDGRPAVFRPLLELE